MTDITELAKSLKASAENAGADCWQAKKISGDFYVIRKGSYKRECGYLTYQPIAEIDHKPTRDYMAMASPANILALVEALEKAQTINAAAEKLVRCKGRYHSEQNYRALAALFGVTTPDLPPLEHENVHYADAAEMEIAALRQRIAELESRTVKLPDLRQIVSGDRYVWSDGVYNYSQDVKVALAAAGIKVEVE
ncbi:ead/Ea22-like family protein [Klebsiella quasipneumoniae]|uniref:ead/Ea22-like family protein n=1 Tax=Klebsiella quasipneumoniae TaxID=1463165 RepID=UPI00164A1A68|nr:ead/Ea22-like family protein [Klebsiella quasipneumoniae]MBC4639649.1 ead/Ea22-like family protein [Klebsiella quasipneumoniae]MBC4691267.1 ead/Ea22-like family protein [Klebsiella quasipneumoniae]MBC4718484.1 ead/Ea22-like family protein [Klebsiella quasipneumoniae]MDL4000321.1 ead/Ea22-like family protein [Klebsiella quasipneumoniae]MDL4055736.1 ead/Ea22-like family protein [Klebsiella quasipneumoniae]